MGTEILPSSPDAAREVAPSTRDFLENLKREVQAVDDAEGKKALIRERLKGMEKKDLDALKQNIDQNQIPQDLLDAIVDLRLLVDAQKAVLREAIANGQASTAEQKPEGWMAWTGDQMKSGTEKVGQWTDWLMGKTKSGVGFGWDKTVEGMKTAGEWMMSIWSKIDGSIGKVRAGIAIALGGVVAEMEKFLPVWLKDGFNMIVGNYGVFYATINRLGVKIKEGATQVVQGAHQQGQASVDTFSKIYDQAKAWGNTALDFPGFILEVANRLKVQKTSLEFTMADMVAMAGIVAGEKQMIPAAPAVAPAEKLPRTKVESLAIGGLEVSKIVEKGVTLLKVGEKKCRVTVGGSGISVTSIEKISDGSVVFNGTVLSALTGTVTVSMTELENVVGELKKLNGKKDIEVTYRNSKNEEKKKEIGFEIVPS